MPCESEPPQREPVKRCCKVTGVAFEALPVPNDVSLQMRAISHAARRKAAKARRRRPRRRRLQGASAVRAPPRAVADTTCPNCLGKGHMGYDCLKPKDRFGSDQVFPLWSGRPRSTALHREKEALDNIENAKWPRDSLAMHDGDAFVPTRRG